MAQPSGSALRRPTCRRLCSLSGLDVELLPPLAQLSGELAAGPPVDADIELAKVLVEVVLRPLDLLRANAGSARHQLHRQMGPPQTPSQVAHERAKQHAKTPIGDPVAYEQQRVARERFLDRPGEQALVPGNIHLAFVLSDVH